MTTTTGIEAFRAQLPSSRTRNVEDYAIDGVAPAIALRPDTRDEAQRIVAAANSAGLVLVPLGARTATALGRPLERYDVALDTTGLARVVEYEPNDLTATVEAGMTLATLQETLAVHGQYLPADPPPNDNVTIGGLLATAPRREEREWLRSASHAHGRARCLRRDRRGDLQAPAAAGEHAHARH
jgi:FAD/FMN-containing dehydrogenase